MKSLFKKEYHMNADASMNILKLQSETLALMHDDQQFMTNYLSNPQAVSNQFPKTL